jgi:hypothetical protein
MKISNRLYKTPEWKDLRLSAIEHTGGKCEKCDRSESEGAILQVHHKKYIRGRKPWEYSFEELTVFCRRCHAEEHKILMETCNWEYCGENSRDERDGVCDFCGNDIKIEHFLSHQHWGELIVGTGCSDFLTETREATDAKNKLNRMHSFCQSRHWHMQEDGVSVLKRRGITVRLNLENEDSIRASVNGHEGKSIYKSIDEAKKHLFEVHDSGKLSEFLKKRSANKRRGVIPKQ